jgi:YHS domain-containing protein
MKKLILLCVAVTAFAFLSLSLAWAAPQTECPVMGGTINKELYVDYKGERVYFCCAGCPETFKKDPEKYMKKLRDEGVELEKVPAEAAPTEKKQ